MIYNKEIKGILDDTSVDIEVMTDGTVEVMTDAPRSCCVSIVKLNEKGIDKLLASLLKAKYLIKENK